jgi:beta-lactamase class A
MTRRGAMGFAMGAAAVGLPGGALSAEGSPLLARAQEIESRLGARVGLSVTDTATGRRWRYRAAERFPLNSTFKAFAAGAVLARVDAGQDSLDRRLVFTRDMLVTYSPVTETRVGELGMTLGELCAAATMQSDNTAANLILGTLGGPEGFTDFMRRIGDRETRLDRWETMLNEARPGDPRDTTTPDAAAASLGTLVLGEALSRSSRQRLEAWMAANAVAGALLRANLPAGWRIADRSGAGGFGARSIIAVVWPTGRLPLVAAIYLTETAASFDARNRAIAELGRALFAEVAA